MFSKPREGLRYAFGAQLAWWYAVVFLSSALALALLTYGLLAAVLRQHDRDVVQGTFIQLAAAYTRGGSESVRREIQRLQIAGMEGPLFVRAVGRGEDVVFVSMPERWRHFDTSQLTTRAAREGPAWSTLDPGGEDPHVLEVLSIRLSDGTLFQVGKSTEHRAEILSRFRRVLLLALAAVVLIGVVGGAVVTRSALAPLRALAETIAAILRTGRTSARVPVQPGGDALADLARLVNAMLDRIDAVVSGMHGALDNVAHDLRTPMARVRAMAESALAANDPEVLRTALAECIEEIDHVVAMLNTMMDISEAQTGTMALRREPVPLRQLVAQSVDLYEDVAEERGITLRAAVPADLVVRVDRPRMRQALANLLDNAVKYTGDGGSVDVRATAEDDRVVIAVADTGIGIPAEDLPHVWERLYRADKSRSTRGLGLGLSLVKAIVEAHGGTVSIASEPGQGTTVELRLPSTGESRLEPALRAPANA
jgi:signal transduction histidine kinase